MADNPLDNIDPYGGTGGGGQATQAAPSENPLDQIDPYEQPKPGALESAGLGFLSNLVPSAGAIAGAGAGGAALSPLGPVGTFIGGVGGAFLGSMAGSAVQDYGVKQMPESAQDQLREKQALADEEHPYSFLGGALAPFALTMNPLAAPLKGATAMQTILANANMSRIYGGAFMAAQELAQEYWNNETPDWAKLAISGAFGMFMQRPNRIGEMIEHPGVVAGQAIARPFEAAKGALFPPKPYAPEWDPVFNTIGQGVGIRKEPLSEYEQRFAMPTLAQAQGSNTVGPGVTEDVSEGTLKRSPLAEMAAQQAERTEASIIYPPPPSDIHADVRGMHPGLFTHVDELDAQYGSIKAHLDSLLAPSDAAIEDAARTRALIEGQLEYRELSGGFMGGTDVRRMREDLANAQAMDDDLRSRRAAWDAGEAKETPETAALRQHLVAVRQQREDLGPEIAAAYRRAAEGRTETVLPAPTAATVTPTPVIPEPPRAPGEPSPQTLEIAAAAAQSPEMQKERIAEDVKRQLVAAGRPTDEAEASGQLIAARYTTRAARFGGALGSAEDLYRREGAKIIGPTHLGSRVRQEIQTSGEEALKKANRLGVTNLIHALERQGATARDIAGVLSHSMKPPEIAAMMLHERELAQTTNEARPSQSLVDRAGLRAEQPTNLREGEPPRTEASSLIGGEPAVAVMDEMRRAAGEKGKVLDSIIRSVPIDVVNDLFGSKRAAKVALHDEAVLQHAPAFNTDLPISDLSERARSVRLLLSEMANARAKESGGAGHTAMEPPEGGPAVGADGVTSLYQGRNPNASITIGRGRPLIKLLKNADASSFLHESGHDFLEQLMRDAVHELAPGQLRDDAQTVADWLDVELGEKIPRRAHEKFARGFEQYMREGRAPSRELAGVFEKFKQWLVAIYQGIKELGKPINDDIRRVFDRLIAEEPQETVIAPERPKGPTLDDIHVADAMEAPVGPESAAAAERVEAEILRREQESPAAQEIAAKERDQKARFNDQLERAYKEAADCMEEVGYGAAEIAFARNESGLITGIKSSAANINFVRDEAGRITGAKLR